MLIVNKVDETTEGEWFDAKVRGEEVSFKIRPLTSDIYANARKNHKVKVNKVNPTTRKMEKVEEFDEDAIGREVVDHVLEDFRGIGNVVDGEVVPYKPTVENKVRVMEIPSLEGELDISDFVFEKAKELAVMSEKDYKKLEKN